MAHLIKFRERTRGLQNLTATAYIGKAGQPAMAINGFVISGPDPGAVPGASTTSPFRWVFVGAKQDRRTCKGCPFARYGIRRYRAIRTGANDNQMALAA